MSVILPPARLPPAWVYRAAWEAAGAHTAAPLYCPVCRGRVGSQGCQAGTVCQGRTARPGCLGRWYGAAHPVPSQQEPYDAQPVVSAAEAEGCAACARVCQDLQALRVPRESEGMLEPPGR